VDEKSIYKHSGDIDMPLDIANKQRYKGIIYTFLLQDLFV